MTDKMKNILCAILLTLAVSMAVIGFSGSEKDTVNTKSTAICMECIGIG